MADQADQMYIRSFDEFNAAVADTAIAGGKPMIINFTGSSGPCHDIGPIFVTISAEADHAGWTFRMVDVDEASDVSDAAGIYRTPTFKVYKGGEEVEVYQGASESNVRALLDE